MLKKLLTGLVQDDENDYTEIFENITKFYDAALFYLEASNKHSEDLSKLTCLHSDNGTF